ncbi:MAG: NAD-dependent deacetylase, partial [Actinobacteria bacterium]|nr:NAD-dependent deacetylase [Actinomycetota bacterium]
TDSGIPDFRGPNGIWTKDPKAERLSSLTHYMRDRDLRVRAWKARLEHAAWTAEPNAAHRALVELEQRGRLSTLITQNIDGLHQAAGTSPDNIIEIHGTIREVMCMSCGDRAPMQRALDRVRAGEDDPPCRSCGGILKSATISFGQSLVAADLHRAQRAAGGSDLFLAIGTSLTVYPVAYLPKVAVDNGARLAILNAEPTPYDDVATWVIRDPLAVSVPALVAAL